MYTILIKHLPTSYTPLKVSLLKLTKTLLFLIEKMKDCIIFGSLHLQIYMEFKPCRDKGNPTLILE